MFGKIKQSGITWKIRKEEQSFFCVTHCRDLIHILIKSHEDIPNHYLVRVRTRLFGEKNNQSGITWKLRKGE